MKIKALKDLMTLEHGLTKAGEVIEVEDSVAEGFIERGSASKDTDKEVAATPNAFEQGQEYVNTDPADVQLQAENARIEEARANLAAETTPTEEAGSDQAPLVQESTANDQPTQEQIDQTLAQAGLSADSSNENTNQG